MYSLYSFYYNPKFKHSAMIDLGLKWLEAFGIGYYRVRASKGLLDKNPPRWVIETGPCSHRSQLVEAPPSQFPLVRSALTNSKL